MATVGIRALPLERLQVSITLKETTFQIQTALEMIPQSCYIIKQLNFTLTQAPEIRT